MSKQKRGQNKDYRVMVRLSENQQRNINDIIARYGLKSISEAIRLLIICYTEDVLKTMSPTYKDVMRKK